MTELKVGVVDVFVVQPGTPMRALVLRRAAGTRCTGAWEVVHGRVEPNERPEDAAVREVLEETGLAVDRLYNVMCHPFYLHRAATVQVSVVFAAFADPYRPVQLSAEHDACDWVPVEQALERLAWPRSRQALRDIEALFRTGDAGPVEDVLRIR